MKTALLAQISQAHRVCEKSAQKSLTDYYCISALHHAEIAPFAATLIEKMRSKNLQQGGMHAFMMAYDLSTLEGTALMCLAEALLRIPDTLTMDKLIADKIALGNWAERSGKSHSFFVNAATWGLLFAHKVTETLYDQDCQNSIRKFLARTAQPVVRQAILQAISLLGDRFVFGQTIPAALKRAIPGNKKGYHYSFDMLGEAAKTKKDAEFYYSAYATAIHAIGEGNRSNSPYSGNGISIKLSALHPRYEYAQQARVCAELYPKLKQLSVLCQHYQIGLTLDAEEVDRLELSLLLLEKLAKEPALSDWQGLGLAVQAYQKRAFYVIDWLAHLAKETGRRFMLRLVKGAYWDSEIKHDQVLGLSDYSVFTRKVHTDVSYLACARKILSATDVFYPQFATHNAYTAAAIVTMAAGYRDFEFQALHGMGEALYEAITGPENLGISCRIYAPVGSHQHLLAYLVRRLLENGANSSFLNQITHTETSLDELTQNPFEVAKKTGYAPHPKICLPSMLYGENRLNAKGIDLNNQETVERLLKAINDSRAKPRHAKPQVAWALDASSREEHRVLNPADQREVVGLVTKALPEDVAKTMETAAEAFIAWDKTSATQRASYLRQAADLLEEHCAMLMQLAIDEAGKTIPNALGEVREAIDFCRYYAEQAELLLNTPTELKGPTGETNHLKLSGRGVVICISPWNFPLAIFLGQVTAALAAGNTVVAKPAEQTCLIAHAAVEILHKAGIPKAVLQLLPGPGKSVGTRMIEHPALAGVIFTGSTEVARRIQLSLAQKEGPLVPLIAETGGQNCMVVDSSALPEQVVTDVIASAFDSAGQRCSALRVLYLQEEIADTVLHMLSGAMAELTIGRPRLLSVDVGPVIDKAAKSQLEAHIETMKKDAKFLKQLELPKDTEHGSFVSPCAFEISHISQLKNEVFGPILHVIRFAADQLDSVIDAINSTGYGLTFGVHSRIGRTVAYLIEHIKAGNVYVNRNMVGAVVGVQPFGGEGLSGTGPKAGGPHYLLRLCLERTVTVNTTAAGGNASLMSLSETLH